MARKKVPLLIKLIVGFVLVTYLCVPAYVAYVVYDAKNSDEYVTYCKLTSDGKNLIVEETDVFDDRNPVVVATDPSASIWASEKFVDGTTVLSVHQNDQVFQQKSDGLSNAVVAQKSRKVYFSENEPAQGKDRIWTWEPALHFIPNALVGNFYDWHLSLDENYLASEEYDDSRDGYQLTIISTLDWSRQSIDIPRGYGFDEILDPNHLLVSRHVWGSNRVYLWMPKAHQISAVDAGGPIAAVATFRGSVWGVREAGQFWDVVRLDETLNYALETYHYDPWAKPSAKLTRLVSIRGSIAETTTSGRRR